MENKFKMGDLIMIPEFDGFDKEYGIVTQSDCHPSDEVTQRIKVQWVTGPSQWIYEDSWTWNTIEVAA